MYNISDLILFNPALVYGFEPEQSQQQIEGSGRYEHTLFPIAGQHVDVLQAYLYAQNTILPLIQDIGIQHITEDMLLEWILTIHKHIGQHLLASNALSSGEYTKTSVIRWKNGSEIFFYTCRALMNIVDYSFMAEQLKKIFVKQLDMNEQVCTNFLNFISKLRQQCLDSSAHLDPVLLSYSLPNMVFKQLEERYQNKTLSDEEKAIIDEVATICMPPAAIPAAMNAFASQAIASWKQCNPQNTSQIAQTLADIFYQLTAIHPFSNGNGRTATCLINTMLVSFGLPSILLRYPGDKSDVDSSYSKAFETIESTREPLALHILNAIQQAQTKPFEDKVLAKTIYLRVTVALKCQELQKKYHPFNSNDLQNTINSIIDKRPRHLSDNKASIWVLKRGLEELSRIENELQNRAVKVSSHSLFSIDKKNPISLYQAAIGAYKNASYNEALTYLEQAVEGFQQHSSINNIPYLLKCYSSLASIYRETKEHDLSFQMCDKALALLKPEDTKEREVILSKYKTCLIASQKNPQDSYQEAIKQYADKQYYRALVQLQYSLEAWQSAHSKPAIIATCYSSLASCQRDLGMIQEAIESCERALALFPTDKVKVKRDNLLIQQAEIVINLRPN